MQNLQSRTSPLEIAPQDTHGSTLEARARALLARNHILHRETVAADLARRHGGALIHPNQNAQPEGVPRLASFRLGRFVGIGGDVAQAVGDWMAQASGVRA